MRYCYYVYDLNNGIWNTSKPVGSTKYSQWKILLNPYLRRPPYFIHVPMYSVTFPWCFPVLRSRPLADSFLKTGALECLEGFLDEWCLPPKNPAFKMVGLSPKNGHLGFWWLVYHQKNEGSYHSNLRNDQPRLEPYCRWGPIVPHGYITILDGRASVMDMIGNAFLCQITRHSWSTWGFPI